VPLAAAVGLGVALRFLVPIPAGITVQAWTLLSIFVSAIVGEHWAPVPPAMHLPCTQRPAA
jgi:divalent anion:Na+ symporter, DASS family